MKKGLMLLLMLLSVIVATGAETAQARQTSVTLTNFEPNLPLVFLEVKQPLAHETKVPCTVKMVMPKNALSANTNVLSGQLRYHGASSLRYPKRSLGLTLDAPMRWLGLRESAHWVLNAAFVDRSLMRHKLSYDLFRSLSTSNAPRFASASRFIEVNFNGRYHGAFLLMERVDRAMFGLRRFDSNATHHSVIYKAVDHAATFDRLGHGGFEQKEPDPLQADHWGPLDRFNRFVSSTKEAEFFDPAKGIPARLDLDNAMDFHLLILLTSNMDGFDKNLILARDAPMTNAPLPKFFFAPWDYDATFGRNWEASRVEPAAWLSNHLFDRLLSNADYRQKFAARWKQLRQREFSVPAIHRMIDENVQTLGPATKRNETRWRTLSGPYPDRLSFEEDVEQMKAWVVARTKWLDEEISRRGQAQ